MKVPISWLREYVDFDDDAQGLADKLTFSGIEVEGIDRIREGLNSVIVAEVLEVNPHPNADRLKLCLVNDGAETLQIVCGADNMKPGDKAAFAPIGCKLPCGIKIKKAKVRGEESFGMLCAEDELGLSEAHDGIYLLEKATPAGTALTDVIGEPDEVLDLEITWNRPDCLSIIGIAREVAALYGTELRMPDADVTETEKDSSEYISVDVQDSDACPRYTGRYLSSVKLGDSPAWMQSRLSACGIRPISNIVDITNYVLLETGHPLHAFDYTLVKKGSIVVRFASKDETITTLDDIERKLSNDILVIADPERPLALAGVMGGAESEIGEGTAEVLLESATFAPPVIHGAVSSLGLNSESSHRFERTVDFHGVEFASRRAASLLCSICGAKAAKGFVESKGQAPQISPIELTADAVSGVMGIEVTLDECKSIFESLAFHVDENSHAIVVTPPSFRPDIRIEADLIEEIARMKGLDSIPAAAPMCHSITAMDDSRIWMREEIRESIVHLGFTETVNYSFMSEKLASIDSAAPGIKLPNPVSADYSVMRGSLAPQMLDMLGRNLAHQNRTCAAFEIGKVFAGISPDILEEEHICFGLMGGVGRYSLDRVAKIDDQEAFLWMKGAIESVFEARGVKIQWKQVEKEFLLKGSGVSISADDVDCGWMGVVSDEIAENYRMQDPVVIAEIDISVLIQSMEKDSLVETIPTFPSISRDIAVVVDNSVLNGDIIEVIESIDCPELTRIELFDIFKGRGTGEDKKSMAYALTFQPSDRTLTDDEANGFRDRIRDGLVSKLNAEIREG